MGCQIGYPLFSHEPIIYLFIISVGMAENITLTPWKRRNVSTDFLLCVICQESRMTKQPSPVSADKLIHYVHKREEVKDPAFQELFQRIINGLTTENIIENNVFYHKQCYSSLTNSEKLKRAEVRFHEAVKQGSSSVTKRKSG